VTKKIPEGLPRFTALHSLRKDETIEPFYEASIDTPGRGVIQPSEVIFLQSNKYPITQPQIDWVKNGQFILYVYWRMSSLFSTGPSGGLTTR
jgi:hypothetical protein